MMRYCTNRFSLTIPNCFPFQFEKPGRRANFDYPQMVKESVTKALADAKINYTEIQQACVGFVTGNETTFKYHRKQFSSLTLGVNYLQHFKVTQQVVNALCMKWA